MTQIYNKSSFDRFGDDLMEVLLSFIPFEDCFRFRCVSKQWKRLIFNKQKHLKIPIIGSYHENQCLSDSSYLRKVELFVKNYPNITSIRFGFNNRCVDQILQILIKYYNNLSEINVDLSLSSESIRNEFFLKFGSNLKKVVFYFKPPLNELKFCPNVTDLTVRRINYVFDSQNDIYCKKLKSFEFVYTSDDMKTNIELLFECNKRSLETIIFFSSGSVSENGLKVLFNSMTKLLKLKSLLISATNSRNIIVKSLQDLAINCKLLKKIDLHLVDINTIELNLKILRAFKMFVNLKILNVILYKSNNNLETFNITSDELKGFQNLTHFELNSDKILITDSFFTSIDKYLPKLQSIKCFNTDITEETFKSLSKLRKLQTIILSSNSLVNRECVEFIPLIESFNELIKNCHKMKDSLIFQEYLFTSIHKMR